MFSDTICCTWARHNEEDAFKIARKGLCYTSAKPISPEIWPYICIFDQAQKPAAWRPSHRPSVLRRQDNNTTIMRGVCSTLYLLPRPKGPQFNIPGMPLRRDASQPIYSPVSPFSSGSNILPSFRARAFTLQDPQPCLCWRRYWQPAAKARQRDQGQLGH